MKRCFWCGIDPDEAASRNEGPHLKWCFHYRPAALPPGAHVRDGIVRLDNIQDALDANK